MTGKEKKPNFILFMPDQLRYDSLGCSGNEVIKTPHIDAFAKQGTKFSNCYEQHTVCSQSRCSMFTSKYPHVTGHRTLESLIQPWEDNFFKTMKDNGYHIAMLAPRGDLFAPEVTELSVDEYGFLTAPELMPAFTGNYGQQEDDLDNFWDRLFYKGSRGIDTVVDYDEAAVRSAEEWLKVPPKEPWILFLPLFFPHPPFTVEEPYFSMYERGEMPLPSSVGDKIGREPEFMSVLRKEYGLSEIGPKIWQELKATYFGMISRLDDQFNRVLKCQDLLKDKDSTYTIFFTDHGEFLGDHGLIEKWPSGLSEVLTHTPLIIRGPEIPAGKTVDSMLEMVDMCPTIFDLAKIESNYPHNGKSAVPVITGKTDKHRDYAFSEGGFLLSEEPLLERAPFPYDIKSELQHTQTKIVGRSVSVRNQEWTYVYRLYESGELYNRLEDPGELHNLHDEADYALVVRKFQSVVLRWMVESSGLTPLQPDPRFPKVTLPTPEEQLERRKKLSTM